ncbi:hypothetical protein GC194_00180, partial [bacterium]|nr:hypothetical protein [bacterium]
MKTKKTVVALVLLFVSTFCHHNLLAQCSVGQTQIIITINTKSFGNEVYWKLKNDKGTTVDSVKSKSYFNNKTYYDTLCVNNNATYTFETYDLWGDGWNGGTYAISANGILLINNHGNSPSNGVNTNGTPNLETTEQFRIKIDTLPDVALYEILSPTHVSCGKGAFTISARVKVVDSTPVDSITAKYKLGSGSTISQTFNFIKPLQQDTIVTISFSKYAIPTAYGNQILKVWTDLALDSVFANDEATQVVFVDSVKTIFPIVEDFTGSKTCGNSSTSCVGDGACDISGFWHNMTEDDIDWSVNQGATPSTGTGPLTDHTQGNSTGKYIFTEASGCQNQTAILQASCMDLSQISNPYLRFWYHMFGASTGKLYVEIDTAGSWITIDSLIGEQQTSSSDPWRVMLVNLLSYKTVANIRLRAITGNSYAGDMAIDDIEIRDFYNLDAKISLIDYPATSSCSDSFSTIKALITNNGRDTLFNTDITLAIRGDISFDTTLIYTKALAFGEYDTVQFNDINLYAGGAITTIIYTSLPKDENNFNDTSKAFSNLLRSPHSTHLRDTGRCGVGSVTLINTTNRGDTTYWYSDNKGLNKITENDSLYLNGIQSDTAFYYQNRSVAGNCFTNIQMLRVYVNLKFKAQLSAHSSGAMKTGVRSAVEYDTIIE